MSRQLNPRPRPEAILQDNLPSSKSKWKLYLGGCLLLAILIGFVSILAFGLVKAKSGPRISGLAPDFSLTSFAGQKITLRELRGRVVVINFWASWCLTCREEAAYLERTWRKYKDKGVIFVGVDYVDTDDKALAYMDEFDITYFNGPDLGTRISQAFNIQGVPETYFIDQEGRLRGVKIGPAQPPELAEKIDALLGDTDANEKGIWQAAVSGSLLNSDLLTPVGKDMHDQIWPGRVIGLNVDGEIMLPIHAGVHEEFCRGDEGALARVEPFLPGGHGGWAAAFNNFNVRLLGESERTGSGISYLDLDGLDRIILEVTEIDPLLIHRCGWDAAGDRTSSTGIAAE